MYDEPYMVFTFQNKTEAEAFLKKLRGMAYKYDIVVWNDILKERNIRPLHPKGFDHGFSKEFIKQLKVETVDGTVSVAFPKPRLLVRDGNGNWSTK